MRYLVLFFPVFWMCTGFAMARDLEVNAVIPEVMKTVFGGQEELHYDISWTGGIKIGEMHLVAADTGKKDGYVIRARITDHGLFKFFYPVDDTFTTYVRSYMKLPYRYDVLQREGDDMIINRLTVYEQDNHQVKYWKNDEPVKEYSLDGPVYNEFSSFFITRTLQFQAETPHVVPTFADKKRREVEVLVVGKEQVDTLFGPVQTYMVKPIMEFRGLYDKDGDTTIWFTDDTCRVPVQINSKILIGSLTARLVRFSNPSCRELTVKN